MVYKFLVKDIESNLSQKAIGTDKGLAKIGDGIVNLSYSVAKSVYLTKNANSKSIIRTGTKVGKKILAEALKEAGMKDFARSRADAHDMADTVEAIVAYIWITEKMSIKEITDFLIEHLEGDLNSRIEEIAGARGAFVSLLNFIKQFLPDNKS